MTQGIPRRNSLYFQLLILLLFSMLAAVGVFYGADWIGEEMVYEYYVNSDYSERKDELYVSRLQEYVSQEKLSTSDVLVLSKWMDKEKVLSSMLVFKDDILVYDSDYPEELNIRNEKIPKNYYRWNAFYSVQFSDGEAEISLSGVYDYQLYNYMIFAALALSAVVFVILVLMGIRKKMNYIRKLSREIEILEGGDLDYSVTVSGKDELTALAQGLECMRKSFKNQVQQEAEIVRENQKIVTQMSHDLRTPLTSIMLYTELLEKGTYKDEEQFCEYIKKIHRKTRRMKQLTDNLFEYSLVSSDQEISMEELESEKLLFYDLFSETISYLEHQGFQVDFQVEWSESRMQVSTDYVSRILDNITSNIQKYADKKAPVTIGTARRNGMRGFYFENRISCTGDPQESTGVGIQSIKNMMTKMGGKCTVSQEKDIFRLILYFPYCEIS